MSDLKQSDVIILAVESSCDETSAAVVKNGREVLSNVISSQIDIHKKYGGVVPEIASRKHIENIDYVVLDALRKANMSLSEISAVAVTYGPGLVGALLVGLSFAKAVAFAAGKPLIGVHHIEGHICANYIGNQDWKPPFICLVVSGGHTHLVYVKDYCDYEILGKTRDDAAGEAFDKVARAINLPYPGGPEIDKLAKMGNPSAIDFPRALLENESFDFSFSGLKSAVLNYLNKAGMMGKEISFKDVAASFQQAVVDVLVMKTVSACEKMNINRVAMAGGVSANSRLRKCMKDVCDKEGFILNTVSPVLCTDNAAMIGSAAYFEYLSGKFSGLDLNAYSSLKLGERKYSRSI